MLHLFYTAYEVSSLLEHLISDNSPCGYHPNKKLAVPERLQENALSNILPVNFRGLSGLTITLLRLWVHIEPKLAALTPFLLVSLVHLLLLPTMPKASSLSNCPLALLPFFCEDMFD